MINNVRCDIKNLDIIEEKVNKLSEIIKEAKSLVDELASQEVEISFSINKV